ncbi:YqgE/AlgH family protein [Novosphingobium sp.]|uniref:YqgE/AlgH family protein n=1 Tax=Novosphingobium sp. TaxID=1874826 RepID=UPI00334123F7
MTEARYLGGAILLAMPGMGDPRFDHAVIAMCVHDANGALGIGVGAIHPAVTLHGLLDDIGIAPGVAPDAPVHLGGPVEQARGFVLHSPDWDGPGTLAVSDQWNLSASTEVLRAIAAGDGPDHWLVALGYAGWGARQLEGEMRQHGWYAATGRAGVLFDTPAPMRWQAAWRAEGIDPAHLVAATGRA